VYPLPIRDSPSSFFTYKYSSGSFILEMVS
jgi:hypothetical protein